MKMPIDVVANKCSAAPVRNSGIDPSIGTFNIPSTTTSSAKAQASRTTSPIAQTLLAMISNGVIGITSRCSIVPCSRSRISAAPVNTIESMVTLLMISITDPNQLCASVGLKRARRARSAGGAAVARVPFMNSDTSPWTICWI